jgi:hypothetical protein
MAIARSTISLLGCLATTAIGVVLLAKVNKKIGIAVTAFGAVCSVGNLMYNLCFRKKVSAKDWQAVSQTDPTLNSTLENSGVDLSDDDLNDFQDDDLELRRHPAGSLRQRGDGKHSVAAEAPVVVSYKYGWRERMSDLFTSRLTEEVPEKEHTH